MIKEKQIYINLSEGYSSPIVKESQKDEWVEYGENNDYFQWLIDRFVKSPTNNAVINNIVKLIYGKGLTALDASTKPNDYAQMKSLLHNECIKQLITDLKLLGQCAIQVIKSKDGKMITEVHHTPVQLLRAEKCNDEGDIEAYWYSDNWDDIKAFPPVRIPAFNTSKESIEILYVQQYSVGMKYYSYVDYQGALPYAVLEEEIANYLINEVQNGFSGTKIINFNNGIPSPEERELIKNDTISKVTGARGIRTIVAFNHSESNKTTIDDVPLNDAPNHYEYLSDECMRKIMLGHNVTSPLLFGIATTTGFSSNADELKNSFILYYNMVIKPFQEIIIGAFEQILAYNSVTLKLYFETLKPLEFTNPNGQVDEIPAKANLSALEVLKTSEKDEIQLASERISKYGHTKGKNWILIDEFDYDSSNDHLVDLEILEAQKNLNIHKGKKKTLFNSIKQMLVSTGNPNPADVSIDDWIIDNMYFITRYKYEQGESSSNTRAFCSAMMSADKLYRKEDIEQMSNDSVNPGWGPNGDDNYDILLWKGGGNCHHLWRRQTYVALNDEYDTPLDPNSSMAKRISTNKAEKYGYRIRNPFETAVMPKDLPNKGFLPK